MDLSVWVYYLIGVIVIVSAFISLKSILPDREGIKEFKRRII
jgi:hypothetical protein